MAVNPRHRGGGSAPGAPDRNVDESPAERSARLIAFLLVGFYGAGLLLIGLVAAFLDDTGNWLDLLKSGFLILGGTLSAVVGYYFGSRGIQDAERRARIAEDAATQRIRGELLADTSYEEFDDEMIRPE